MRLRFLAIPALVLAASVAMAADAPQRVVVKAARMIDVRGGQVVAPAIVVIENDRIVAVGSGRCRSRRTRA